MSSPEPTVGREPRKRKRRRQRIMTAITLLEDKEQTRMVTVKEMRRGMNWVTLQAVVLVVVRQYLIDDLKPRIERTRKRKR
jgi:hypothetical protein